MHCSQDRKLLTVQFAQHRLLPVRSPSRNLPSCFPTLPSIHPAADVLAMSCTCKSGSKSGGTLQMDHRRPKNVVTTLRKRRPDELPHFFERFPNWHPIREARKFPCHIPTMAQTTIQPRALAEWRTNFNCLPVLFERQKEKIRKTVIVPAFISSSDMPDSDRYIRMCACIRVTTTTTTN